MAAATPSLDSPKFTSFVDETVSIVYKHTQINAPPERRNILFPESDTASTLTQFYIYYKTAEITHYKSSRTQE